MDAGSAKVNDALTRQNWGGMQSITLLAISFRVELGLTCSEH